MRPSTDASGDRQGRHSAQTASRPRSRLLTVAWVLLVADLGYSLTFGRYDATLLRRSLIADLALPLALLLAAPSFFRGRLPSRGVSRADAA